MSVPESDEKKLWGGGRGWRLAGARKSSINSSTTVKMSKATCRGRTSASVCVCAQSARRLGPAFFEMTGTKKAMGAHTTFFTIPSPQKKSPQIPQKRKHALTHSQLIVTLSLQQQLVVWSCSGHSKTTLWAAKNNFDLCDLFYELISGVDRSTKLGLNFPLICHYWKKLVTSHKLLFIHIDIECKCFADIVSHVLVYELQFALNLLFWKYN